MPTRPELEDARRRLQKALNEAGSDEVMRRLAEGAFAITKRVRHAFDCKYCHRHQVHYVEITDPVGAAQAYKMLSVEANGPPQEAQNDSGVTVNYRVELLPE